jgi:ParB/RepB/Spo0J family partition protein
MEVDLAAITIGPDRLHSLKSDIVDAIGGSLRANGQINPVTVRPKEGGGYELVAGRHRVEAARQIGWSTIEAKVIDKDADGALLVAIDENLARASLTPEEQAEHRRRKNEIIDAALKAAPEQSDRRIAKQIGEKDHKKIGRRRQKLESTGALPQLKKTVGADGKTRKAKPKRPAGGERRQRGLDTVRGYIQGSVSGLDAEAVRDIVDACRTDVAPLKLDQEQCACVLFESVDGEHFAKLSHSAETLARVIFETCGENKSADIAKALGKLVTACGLRVRLPDNCVSVSPLPARATKSVTPVAN